MKNETILIVDDKPENIYSLKEILHDSKVNIFEANSGEDCLEILLEKNVDIILLDIQMPTMDGYETAKFVRQNNKTEHIPILFITAANQADSISVEAYESGAVDVIFKPINPIILENKINVFLEIIRIRKQLKEQVEKLTLLDEENKKMQEEIKNLAMFDYLTDVANRRKLDEEYEKFYKNAVRKKKPISLLMIDVDDFKAYNDYFGHTKGDRVLVEIAEILRQTINRSLDIVGRFGGEEFLIILPDTDLKGAKKVASNILDALSKKQIEHSPNCDNDYVSISIGIDSEIPIQKSSKKELLDQADQALYNAKHNGKNQFQVFKNDN